MNEGSLDNGIEAFKIAAQIYMMKSGTGRSSMADEFEHVGNNLTYTIRTWRLLSPIVFETVAI